MGKTDSTGTYAYVCDGASPGAPVLSDGHAVYTPGLSESRAGVSTYMASDVLGNLWFMDGVSPPSSQTYYQDTTAFGVPGAIGGTEAGPFKFGGGNGCQTDVDLGLVLMGHRYYDTRVGRFISQDPAGDGDNWYAYAGNSPTNKVDPSGLITQGDAEQGQQNYNNVVAGLYDFYQITNGDYEHAKYLYTKEVGFQSISILGMTPSTILNFPNNVGSQFLTQRMKYAKVEYQRAKYDVPGRVHWLTSRVGKGNVWDLKKDVSESQNPLLWRARDSTGNFMYGAIATGVGFHAQLVQFGGGYAQYLDQGLLDASLNVFSHFDDQWGQAEIDAGITWARMGQPTFSVAAP